MEPSIPKKRWRPRVRFTLRALMIAMTLICLWLGYQVSAARTQQRVVEQLREADVRIEYRDETLASTGQPPSALRQWVGKWFGIDHVDVVFAVHVGGRSDPGRVMPLIARLPHLNTLTIYDLSLSDKNLQCLRSLKSLQQLEFHYCQINEHALPHLADCHALRWLVLVDSPASAEDLGALANIPQLDSLLLSGFVDDQRLAVLTRIQGLRQLWIRDCQITDQGMTHVGQMQELRKLHIDTMHNHPPISDAGLRELAVLKHLEDLSVGSIPKSGLRPMPRISADGLRQLAHLPLKRLKVFTARMGDDDLEWLTRIPSLESLKLIRTQVSEEGEAYLNKNMPGLKNLEVIRRDFDKPVPDLKWVDALG